MLQEIQSILSGRDKRALRLRKSLANSICTS